ncbi:phosphoribosyltransferase family protein [Nonomuraea sp. CA-141351]|uniref:phosphoribosyltransferase family protein n=1 Tax=Nonomuraea sp. CA-141351 TaxID=3239996 RepID=UPI003D8BB70F
MAWCPRCWAPSATVCCTTLTARSPLSAAEAHDELPRTRAFDTPPRGPYVIVVDDGVATGGTARTACQVAHARGASRVILAVPVGAPDTIASLQKDADEVICLETPAAFWAIGAWYVDLPRPPTSRWANCCGGSRRPGTRRYALSRAMAWRGSERWRSC